MSTSIGSSLVHPNSTPLILAPQNRLLRGMSRRDLNCILRTAKLVQLEAGTILGNKDRPLRYVYFPVDCYVGVYSSDAAPASIAVTLVGSEGMLGSVLLLGSGQLPGTAIVVGGGTAWRMSKTAFAAIVEKHTAMRRYLMRYLHHAIINIAQHAGCSHFHSIEARLARWLLMISDRVGSDRFVLTQQTLADLLGVQRVGVTLAASALQARNVIDYRRGVISLIDRQGLLASACHCYGISEAHYQKFVSK